MPKLLWRLYPQCCNPAGAFACLQGFKGDQFDLPHNAKLLGEGGSATIYQESLSGELRATKYPKKVSAFDIRWYCLPHCLFLPSGLIIHPIAVAGSCQCRIVCGLPADVRASLLCSAMPTRAQLCSAPSAAGSVGTRCLMVAYSHIFCCLQCLVP